MAGVHHAIASTGAPPITVDYCGSANVPGGALPHVFSSVPIGLNRPKKLVIIAAGQIDAAATYPTSCLVNTGGGNVAATRNVFKSRTYGGITIFSIDVAGGTTATITIDHSNGSQNNTYIKVYAIYDLPLGTLHNTGVFNMDSNPNSGSLSVSFPAQSVAIGFVKASGSNSSNFTAGTVDLTNASDQTYGTSRRGSSAYEIFNAAVSGTLTASIGGGAGQAAIYACFK